MDSFALTDQEKQLLSKEKATLQIFNQNGEEVFPIQMERKTFSAIQIALNEKNRGIIKKTRLAFTMQIVATFSL